MKRQSFRAIELECAWRSSLCNEALSFAQQDWIDEQHDLIRKPVFEPYRCQCRAAPDDQVRPKALERAPFKTFRTVGSDIFCCPLRPSAIGLLGAFGQKPDQRS